MVDLASEGLRGAGEGADDPGHDRTVGRLWSRREALRLTAGLGVSLAGGGWWSRAWAVSPVPPLIASPAMTEGPFFVDEKMNRADLVGGTDRPAVVNAAPLRLNLGVFKLDETGFRPMPGVQVDLWHCDAVGVYSDTDASMNHEQTGGQDWLRGFQRSDGAGQVVFETIVPGWYRGRTPHIHFKVRPPAEGDQPQREFTSQLFFDHAQLSPIYAGGAYAARGQPDRSNAQDNIYNAELEDGTVAGDLLRLHLTPRNPESKKSPSDKDSAEPGGTAVYDAELAILLTDAGLTTRRAGRGRFGGGPGGGGPGRGGPPGDGPPGRGPEDGPRRPR